MVTNCSSYGCTNHRLKDECRKKGISFHNFPHSQPQLLKQWLIQMKRVNFIPKSETKICSEHFEEYCFEYQPFTNRRQLKKDAVPTKFHFNMTKDEKKTARKKIRDVIGFRSRTSIIKRPADPVVNLPRFEMTESKYQDRILETIDQLRKRKARPDLERICHMVERRYGISPAQTQGELERLVDSEIVIKVDYKGSTSYRNAAKWGKKKALSGQVLNSNDVSRTLCEAVRALLPELQQTVAAQSQGVNIREIEKYIVSQNALSKLTKNKLQVALDREVSISRIQKLPNGNYLVPEAKPVINSVEVPKPIAPSNPKPIETDAIPIEPPQAVKPVPGSARKGRPPNKRKRFKKTHGPDFVENYDSSFEEPEPKCDYCLLTATSNCNGKPEELLVCKDCNAKAHPSCMDYSAELAMRSRMSPWQCMDCKTCYICNDSGEADSMLFCDACDKGFHMGCHAPKVTDKPNGKWVCHHCSGNSSKKGSFSKVLPMEISEAVELNEVEQTKQTIDGAPGLPTPCESPVPDSEQNKKSFSDIFIKKESSIGAKENEDPEVPDASEWTIEDVENYFKLAGFPDQALAFKEQEIDGKSLLLMKRSDVLTGLSIKLGPALKIYNHVKRLQTRRLDGHLIY